VLSDENQGYNKVITSWKELFITQYYQTKVFGLQVFFEQFMIGFAVVLVANCAFCRRMRIRGNLSFLIYPRVISIAYGRGRLLPGIIYFLFLF
jgi:hypothetical protein